MNALELALKKQRLQIAGASLRSDIAQHSTGLAPIFTGADFVADAVRYLRRRPELVIAAGVALVVARPSRAWRWGRRAFFGWQAWRRWRNFLDRPPTAR
ncbi:MAG: YqjK-like family protein [Sulfuritalea sp.]|nr:YqjK-like family protein [Sulfuritalea sp.]